MAAASLTTHLGGLWDEVRTFLHTCGYGGDRGSERAARSMFRRA